MWEKKNVHACKEMNVENFPDSALTSCVVRFECTVSERETVGHKSSSDSTKLVKAL